MSDARQSVAAYGPNHVDWLGYIEKGARMIGSDLTDEDYQRPGTKWAQEATADVRSA